MTLQEKIKKDLAIAMKEKNEPKKSAIRVILGEMGRGEKKEVSDDETVKILKKLIKSEKELIEKSGKTDDSEFIKIVETYLPAAVSEQEVTEWIKQNVDFAQYKNKMQAMGAIMKHFGSAVDGNTVKAILQKM